MTLATAQRRLWPAVRATRRTSEGITPVPGEMKDWGHRWPPPELAGLDLSVVDAITDPSRGLC